MDQTKSIEKSTTNYLLSTVRGMFNTAQHYMELGYSVEHSIENAWRYGQGMLRASVGGTITLEDAERCFRQLGTIANLLADKCHESIIIQGKANAVQTH